MKRINGIDVRRSALFAPAFCPHSRPMEFEVLPVTRFKMNCSILWCEKTLRAAVIDPGGDLSEILNVIELMELTPEVALVTHGHFDHCGAAAQFAELTGARIEGP